MLPKMKILLFISRPFLKDFVFPGSQQEVTNDVSLQKCCGTTATYVDGDSDCLTYVFEDKMTKY